MRSIAMLLFIAALLGDGTAFADQGGQGKGVGRSNGGGNSFFAPEPVTTLGVALGAGVAGFAAWRVRRKKK